MVEPLPFQYRNTGDGTYDVGLFGVHLGGVRRERDAWSYGQWFVDGLPGQRTTGGYSMGTGRGDRRRAPQKLHGFASRDHAAQHLAMMCSGKLVAAMCERDEAVAAEVAQ